jgi:peptidoglycan hydrolase CwlO-like protein
MRVLLNEDLTDLLKRTKDFQKDVDKLKKDVQFLKQNRNEWDF